MNREYDQPPLITSEISFDDLRSRQSVRATFKLPQESIDLLGVIAGQLGIKQKSLLDQLVEDTSLLVRLARDAGQTAEQRSMKRQKTFVISRSSLRSINDIARKQKISRDVLVEISIKRLLPIVESELEKHIIRKNLLKEMKGYFQLGVELLGKTEKMLGKNDVLYDMLEKQISQAEKNIADADSIVEKGRPMESW